MPTLELDKFQISDLTFYLQNPKCLNRSDAGTRKTGALCVYMWHLWEEYGVKTLINVKISLHHQWKEGLCGGYTDFAYDEVAIISKVDDVRKHPNAKIFICSYDIYKNRGIPNSKWLSIFRRHIPVERMSDSMARAIAAKNDKVSLTTGVIAPVMNINKEDAEELIRVFQNGYYSEPSIYKCLKEIHPEINACVVDELHMAYTEMDSLRTACWVEAMRYLKYFVGATGTFIAGKLSSAYPSIHVIEPRYYMNFQDFMNQHALVDIDGKVSKWVNTERLIKILDKHSIRRSFGDIYGEEKVNLKPIYLAMSQGMEEMYSRYHATQTIEVIETAKNIVTGDNFQQLVTKQAKSGGEVYLRKNQILHSPEVFGYGYPLPKDDFIASFAQNTVGKPLVIFSNCLLEQDRLYNRLKHITSVEIIRGSVSKGKRHDFNLRFKNGDLKVLICTPSTASVGYDWQHVTNIIFTGGDYKDASFIQGFRRLIRGIRPDAINILYLIYNHSVDIHHAKILMEKMELAQSIEPDKKVYNLL